MDAYWGATLFAGFPFRHAFNDSDSFFVAAATYTAEHLYVRDVSVRFDNELDEHLALDITFAGHHRIFDVLCDIFEEFSCAAREFRHLFYYLENLGLYDLFLFNFRSLVNIFLDNLVLVNLSVKLDILYFNIVFHNLNLGYLRLWGLHLRLWLLLLCDFYHFFLYYLDLSFKHVNGLFVIAFVFEDAPDN